MAVFRLKFIIMLTVFTFFGTNCTFARSLMMQTFDDATRVEVFAGSSASSKIENDPAGPPHNALAYQQALAHRMFGSHTAPLIVNVNKSTRNIFVPRGRIIVFRLAREGSATWSYECNRKILENIACDKYVSCNNEGEIFSIIFHANKNGRTKLYLDYIDHHAGDVPVVLGARVINIIVG